MITESERNREKGKECWTRIWGRICKCRKMGHRTVNPKIHETIKLVSPVFFFLHYDPSDGTVKHLIYSKPQSMIKDVKIIQLFLAW